MEKSNEKIIWIYKPPAVGYMIAKRSPFSYYNQVMDVHTGYLACQLVQGISMPEPQKWDWKRREHGKIFAGLGPIIYDITDLEHGYYPRLL
jgi:hypothetical protein